MDFSDSELELVRVRASLEEWRRYLAGPCDSACIEHGQIDSLDEPYNGHQHWTEHYEFHRGEVVVLNRILDGDYSYPTLLVSDRPD